MPRVTRFSSLRSSTSLTTLALLALLAGSASPSRAAVPFTEATVTRLQNRVNYGEQRGGESVTRLAAVQDVVKARNFLLTENDARAELQYPDGSIVRVGQNTVFTFEADSRTLSLTKGTFIFYVPKGQGGVIKTPSLTAAITGTVGKVSRNTIAFLDGSGRMIPSGEVVKAGQFVRRNPNGTLTIDFLNPATKFDGVLVNFNGPLPPFREDRVILGLMPDFNALALQETLDRTANHPSANLNFFPPVTGRNPSDGNKGDTQIFVAPVTTPTQPSPPGRGSSGGGNSGFPDRPPNFP